MVQWGYGESVTEESDSILHLEDSCLEVRGDLVIAKQFFCDDAVDTNFAATPCNFL